MWQRTGEAVRNQRQVARKQIGQCGSGAAIRHMGQADSCPVEQVFARHVSRRTGARRPETQLARPGPGHGLELRQGIRLELWAREEDQRQDDAEEDDFGPIELKKLEAALAEASTPEGLKQLDQLAKENGYNSIDHYLQNELEWHPGWASEDRSVLEDITRDDKGERPNKQSFWFDEEDPETNTEELEEFDEDDITSMAHGKLDEIRDMRQYARLAVWELPLLSSEWN